MKKNIMPALAAAALICLFAGCGTRNNIASPGSLVIPSRSPIAEETMPTEEEVREAICNVTWLDTDSFDEYTLSEDGSLSVTREKNGKTECGAWQLVTDKAGALSLKLSFEASAGITLYQLELYETSIFAVDEAGEAYIWLLQD